MIQKIVDRIRQEPVLLITLGIILLTTAKDAMASGLDMDAVLLAVAQAALGFVARELVFSPATHEEEVAVAVAEALAHSE